MLTGSRREGPARHAAGTEERGGAAAAREGADPAGGARQGQRELRAPPGRRAPPQDGDQAAEVITDMESQGSNINQVIERNEKG